MRRVQKGTSLAAACLLALATSAAVYSGSALAQDSAISQSLGFTADRAGIQLTYTPLADEPLLPAKKASDFLTQTLSEYSRQFPDKTASLSGSVSMTISVTSNRQLVFTVHPWNISENGVASVDPLKSAKGAGGAVLNAPPTGDPPDRPGEPPGYPTTPYEVTDAVYRSWRNGYRRDTQYHRNPNGGPNGTPGPWNITRDGLQYIGGAVEVVAEP